ncbi:MAG: hypothetical protein KJO06_02775 [Gemmatimonadetes bacterium]|nr:hypothetical protein [Gemmatimonadota bacterium]NNK49947.1 hypothetical protein [Gemmatimonadota bacterium]
MSPRGIAVTSLLVFGLVAGSADPAIGQSVRVTVPEENFRKEPGVTGSNRLATVFEGAVLKIESRQGRWVQATIEGWIWSPSVESTDRDGFDLVVSNPGGENLREAPEGNARRVGRLMRGMLLDRVGGQGNWTRVRRSAWVWSESTVEVPDVEAMAGASPVDAAQAGGGNPVEEETIPPRPSPLSDRILVSGERAYLHVSPSGDTLASLRPQADLQVLARQGSWARVKVEGWVWVPSTLPADSAVGSAGLSPADVTANPDQYRGRQVRWRLQFVSVERAEPARSDFYEGEPFMLARAPDGEQGFVYVAVPPELLTEAEGLRPLQMIDVLARVRTGRSALMGVPVVDLIALN